MRAARACQPDAAAPDSRARLIWLPFPPEERERIVAEFGAEAILHIPERLDFTSCGGDIDAFMAEIEDSLSRPIEDPLA